jgi:hypothetical protein
MQRSIASGSAHYIKMRVESTNAAVKDGLVAPVKLFMLLRTHYIS